MARRPVARRLLLGSARALLCVAAVGWASPACYTAGDGTGPPPDKFYYPVGLAVSGGGNVLYVANSDFDLQWNGGTIQSYDLFMIRRHTAELIAANETNAQSLDPAIPIVPGYPPWKACSGISNYPPPVMANGTRVFLQQGCSPPVDSSAPVYFKNSAVIGAFATDLQISHDATRMFVPVRGNATVTWADLNPDDPTKAPKGDPFTSQTAVISPSPFEFACGQGGAPAGSRCDAIHQAGNDPSEPGDTRNATMPGEPFGLAQTQDGTAMAVTHQSTPETSLLLTGLRGAPPMAASCPKTGVCNPSMQFVLEGMPTGGNGIAFVPHDRFAVTRCEDQADQPPCVRQAFLQTSHLSAEVDLLRYFDDDGSTLHRPFLEKERAYSIVTNIPGTDSRGIVIDPTPSLVCEAQNGCSQSGPPSPACVACGQKPSRVFIANRAPASIIYGQMGRLSTDGSGVFDPDQLILQGNVPLLPGPSRLYLAPIVDQSGHYALRLFVVCYDSAAIFVFDPEKIAFLGPQAVPETVIYVGAGPFAMAFDPFNLEDVAAQEVDEQQMGKLVVGPDLRQEQSLNLKKYRFAYLASFTNSYLQVIDLDDSLTTSTGAPNQETFEQVVFTLGPLTSPKGT